MPRTIRAALGCALLAVILLGSLTARAATPVVVRDVNSTVIAMSSYPAPLGVLNGKMLFGATDETGHGLWITDGNPAGTQLLERLAENPGSYGNANAFATVGNRVYFSGNDGTHGTELWVTDGTAAGTSMVLDINATQNFGSFPQFLAVIGSKMLLSVFDGTNGYGPQLYVSDGTAAGTRALTNIAGPGQGVQGGAFVTGTKAYFAIQDVAGYKMMVTDGTPSGTHETSNPYAGTDAARALAQNPTSYQQLGGRVLYASDYQLWSIDVASDTVTNVASADVQGGKLIPMNGYVLFLSANSASSSLELWRSDGTNAGTFKVATVDVAPNYSLSFFFEKIGNQVVFRGNGGSGGQLLASDGTSVTTLTNGGDVSEVAVIGNLLYFTMEDTAGATTSWMWRSDGTLAGTRKITAFGSADTSSSSPSPIAYGGDASTAYFEIPDVFGSRAVVKYDPVSDQVTVIKGEQYFLLDYTWRVDGSRLYFSPDDFARGNEPWVTDGTVAGTQRLKNIYPETATADARPDWLVAFDGRVAFTADDDVSGRELWISDGTLAGTTQLADVIPGSLGSDPVHPFVFNGALYFFANEDATGGRALMKLAAGASTPITLAPLSPDITPATPPGGVYAVYPISCAGPQSAALGNNIFFAANDGVSDLSLWMSDGTSAGTRQVRDQAGVVLTKPCAFTVFRNRVFIIAVDGLGIALWATDGTAAGTVRIADVSRGTYPGISVLAVLGDQLYFAARTDAVRLWKTDGTAAGTKVAMEFPSPLEGLLIARGVLNGKMLLRVQNRDSMTLADIWASDGTLAGSTRLATVSNPSYLVPVSTETITVSGNKAYFVGGQGTSNGKELWVTDGSASGTRVLKDVNAAGGTLVYRLVSLGAGMALFTVVDSMGGEHLWRTDGTTVGTVLISDVPPVFQTGNLAFQSGEVQLVVGTHYFFVGQDPTLGNELLTLADELPIAGADSGTSTNGAAASINVLANDTDSDGVLDNTTVKVTTSPSHGTVAVGSNGVLSYTPTSGYSGTDTFAYTVSDNQGGASAPATVTVTSTTSTVPPVTSGGSGGGKGGGGAIGVLELFALLLLIPIRTWRAGCRTRTRAPGVPLISRCRGA